MNKTPDIYDSKYKTYVSQIEKALRAFENTSEWADLISSLARLNKVLVVQSQKFSTIPKKTLVGKRLAQCLHPALPSGVHLKALETYDLIFKSIGADNLAVDIFTYSSGLFPLLGYAAINVRPVLLNLYESHFLPLGVSVKPAMTGLIMSLLPGYENGSEFHDRIYQLLESFCDCVEKQHFYNCLWECICVGANVRHAGLNYIIMHFDKKLPMEDQIFLIGNNLDLLVKALCLSLQDSSSLVQRCVLDLTISCFPIHNCQLPKSDVMKVLMFAVTTLLKRDMSLNRRLYAWLMGTDINGMPIVFPNKLCFQENIRSHEVNYFDLHSKELLTNAIKLLLENDFETSFPKNPLLPLKIIICLLDRPELISNILSDLLLDILQCLYRECVIKLKHNIKRIIEEKICFTESVDDDSFYNKLKIEEHVAIVEIYKTANILFAKFDPHFIWMFIAELFESICLHSARNNITIYEFCNIVHFLLDKICVETYMETQAEQIPIFLSHVVNILEGKLDDLSNLDIISTLTLCQKMFSRTMSVFSIFSEYCFSSSGSTVSKSTEDVIRKDENSHHLAISSKCRSQHENVVGIHETPGLKYIHINEKYLTFQNCITSFNKDYLIFFHLLVSKRIINGCIQLQCMDCLFSLTNENFSDGFFNESNNLMNMKLDSISKTEVEILKYAFHLMEECFSFGNYDISFDSDEMPSWFQSLLAICIVAPFDIQYLALNHMFNLIALFEKSACFTKLYKSCVKILSETCFYKMTASSLWRFISESNSKICFKAVEIFNRIHQNAPSSWICEDVIARELLSSDHDKRINSSMKFMAFWNCLKEVNGLKTKQFERSILIILDNLGNNNYLYAALSKSWVISCSKSGDIISILEPIVKVLLHPETARVSVQQNESKINKQQASFFVKDSFNSKQNETIIFSVSNEGGHIVYHIDNENKHKSLKKSAEGCKSTVGPSLSEYDGLNTWKSSALKNNHSNNSKSESNSVVLHINLTGSSEEDNVNMSKINQNLHYPTNELDYEICDEERIFFHQLGFISSNIKMISEILDEILFNVICLSKTSAKDFSKEILEYDIKHQVDVTSKTNVHSLRSYVLFYIKKYDFSRVTYAIELLKNVILVDSKLILNILLTSNMNIIFDNIEPSGVIDLFLRHKQSILGQNFHYDIMFDVSNNIDSGSYLEVVIFGLLYFVRSFFSKDMRYKVTDDDILKNKEVQISCCDLLYTLFTELAKLSQDNVMIVQHISNLLLKSKVQKTVLYSLYSGLDLSVSINSAPRSVLSRMHTNSLLMLISSLIELEAIIHSSKLDHNHDSVPKELQQLNLMAEETLKLKTEVVFLSGQPIIYQPIFLEAIIYSLKQGNDEQMLTLWVNFIQNLLPYLSKAYTKFLTSVILQLCYNMENFKKLALNGMVSELSPDYYIFLMKSLTSIYHYCIFDSPIGDFKAYSNQNAESGILQSFGGQLISGLSNAFNFQTNSKDRKLGIQEEPLQCSNLSFCSQILDLLPKILINILDSWKFSEKLDDIFQNNNAKINFAWSSRIKQCLLSFLNPLADHFMPTLLMSFTIIWNEKFQFRSYDLMIDAMSSSDQLAIVNILKEVKHVNLYSFAATVKHVLKQPSTVSSVFHKSKVLSSEGGLLQMFYAFLKQLSIDIVAGSVIFIISFLRDCSATNLDSSAILILIWILHFVLQKSPMIEEKKEHKEIHDITIKLLESCSNIAGLSLEQAYFFRRYLAVREDLMDVQDGDSKNDEKHLCETSSCDLKSQNYKASKITTYSQSVQALYVLANVTATLLDVVFQSDEKDKVAPLLNNILSSVFPYLRNHKLSNVASFTASSKLLANLSSYQYTRRSWKKECFELLLDASFFQMDLKSLKFWIIIIDNLMAHDKSTFSDLIARFNLTQSSSLNLFGSREAESEMKIHLLKRLSFTIFCSEIDQYQKFMPDIQERLFDCLRLYNSPRLHAEVFSCFRVLVLRMSNYCLSSLWPTMITELTQVLITIEQNLILESEDCPRSYKTTDSLVNTGCDKSYELFLAACKLLDLFLALPTENLPHFQLYKWAFVSDLHFVQSTKMSMFKNDGFEPHAMKLAKHMDAKYGFVSPKESIPNKLIIHAKKIFSLQELHEFFSSICNLSLEIGCTAFIFDSIDKCNSETSNVNLMSPLKAIEYMVLSDFLEELV